MADRLRLAGPAYLGATAADIYTAGASTVTSLLQVHVVNRNPVSYWFCLSIGTDEPETRLYDKYVIGPNETFSQSCLHVIGNSEKLQAFAELADKLSMTLSGEAVTS